MSITDRFSVELSAFLGGELQKNITISDGNFAENVMFKQTGVTRIDLLNPNKPVKHVLRTC